MRIRFGKALEINVEFDAFIFLTIIVLAIMIAMGSVLVQKSNKKAELFADCFKAGNKVESCMEAIDKL